MGLLGIGVPVADATPSIPRKPRVGCRVCHNATEFCAERFGLERMPRPQTGLGLDARLGLAAAHKYSGAQAHRKAKGIIDLEVDPTAPKGVRDVAPADRGCAVAAARNRQKKPRPRPGGETMMLAAGKTSIRQEQVCVTSTS
jgi:hypothetical protein